jgi:hypothetical protein
VLAVLAVPSGGGLSSGEKEDRGNRWVLGAFSVIALLGRLLRIISGVCIEKSLQRAGGNPAGTSA